MIVGNWAVSDSKESEIRVGVVDKGDCLIGMFDVF